jgi:hypothetical protein
MHTKINQFQNVKYGEMGNGRREAEAKEKPEMK